MRIAIISDTHNNYGNYTRNIENCDAVLHCGDFSMRGYRHELDRFIQWYSELEVKYKIFISGNHDFICQEENDLVRHLASSKGLIYLEQSGVEIEGIKIWGSPWTPWFHDWAFNMSKDRYVETAKQLWQEIPPGTDIVMTHGPPYGIGDRVARPRPKEDPNVGDIYLLEAIERINPRYHCFGHIHEGNGIYQPRENGTTYINASILNIYYTPANKPVIIELEPDGSAAAKE